MRKKGWKVMVGHHRQYFAYDSFTGKRREYILLKKEYEELKTQGFRMFLDAKGGKTTVSISIPDYMNEHTGVSECSNQEHYRRATGLKKAVARAISGWMEDQKNIGN